MQNTDLLLNAYGQQRKKGIFVYLPKLEVFDDLETKKPELILELNPNYLHQNQTFDSCKGKAEFKVTQITRPNGIKLKHIELFCEAQS